MTTLEQLQDEWDQDAEIDSTDLGEESRRQPKLHAKWLKYLNQFKYKAFAQKKKVDHMTSIRLRYFNGELGPTILQEYGWEPWNLKKKVNADIEKLFAYELCLETCHEVLKGIKSRGFDVKNTQDWRKFEAGN